MGGVVEVIVLEHLLGVSCKPLCASVSCFVNGAKFPRAPDTHKHPVSGSYGCLSGRYRSRKPVPGGSEREAARLGDGLRKQTPILQGERTLEASAYTCRL